ncbi:hypothetical protein I5Q34_26795 [Streptomyces sp. AV19]|uniref:hypothetical protein n=1 Tax=Streptomyces sp. AV19 TaxID=2793068 RepID=UPI0018FE2872|nr:hypothetical protein [Streptomyces sp. AV19]MBH1937835.1 hypothetical protein [Streptomyces sp. AV19]MDG4537113.1 hypothetical protein [Streptomyces sp. AV19]
MSPTPSPQQPRSIFELRAGALRLAVERVPHPHSARSGPVAQRPSRCGERGRRRRRVKALLWRAALGGAYAIGTGGVTVAVHQLIAWL